MAGRVMGDSAATNDAGCCIPNRSKRVILGAFRMLNNAALNGVGAVLLHPVVMLSCVAISLSTVANKGGAGHGVGLAHDDNHGNACVK